MYVIRNWVEIPLSSCSLGELAEIKRQHTYAPKSFGKITPDPILGYRLTPTHILLPLAWGKMCYKGPFVDARIKGNAIPQLGHGEIVARTPQQADFFNGLIEKLNKDGYCFGKADTGSGKSVAALNAVNVLKRRTLVVVPQENIMQQWKDEIVKHLKLSPDDIGLVQQDSFDFDKPISIALVHSLARRRYSPEFYKAFPFVVFDECDTLGARSFSTTIGLFAARYKLALTATPIRKDGCSGLFMNQFGHDFVTSSQEVMPCSVKPIVYNGQIKPRFKRCYNFGMAITAVAEDEARNQWLAGWLRWMINKGRNVLGVSDRIEQLERLREILTALGITSVVYKAKLSKEEKLLHEKTARVILATRGTFRRAKNIPRLDAGIDLTPSAEPEQEIGRVRRVLPDKLIPMWLTPLDRNFPFLFSISMKRLRLCEQLNGVTVLKD